MSGPNIFMVAGEASGDLHGSRLAMELKRLRPNCHLMGIGGPKMSAAGVELMYSLHDFAFLGFSEVLAHLPFVLSVLRKFKHIFKEQPPDLIILIDYPGFNIRLAKLAKRRKIPVLYYISPQVWAWQSRRAGVIAKLVDRLVVVLPFEKAFYRKRTDLRPHFVGHPLLEVVHSRVTRVKFCQQWQLDPTRPILGFLPGSRRQEVDRLLPVMLAAGQRMRRRIPSLQLAVGTIATLPMATYEEHIRGQEREIRFIQNATYDLMRHAHLLLVASGTATLEAAIMGIPMIILYKVSFFSWLLALLLIRVQHIGLVNLVAGKKIVPELVQHQVTASGVAREAISLMRDGPRRQQMIDELSKIHRQLGTQGASRRTAELALSLIADKR